MKKYFLSLVVLAVFLNGCQGGDSAELIKFKATSHTFKNEWQKGVDAWGIGHGEQPNWVKLCYGDVGIAAEIGPIVFNFQANSDVVNVDLDCKPAGGHPISPMPEKIVLKYSATTLSNDALLIKFDDDGKKVMHDQAQANVPGPMNQLGFFTKPNWFLTKDQDKLKGTSLLKYVGFYPTDPDLEFKTEKDIDEGIAYVKKIHTDGGEAFDIEFNDKKANALTFEFTKVP